MSAIIRTITDRIAVNESLANITMQLNVNNDYKYIMVTTNYSTFEDGLKVDKIKTICLIINNIVAIEEY